MAKISVNEEFLINGKLTIRRVLNDGELTILGSFATHYYFEEIKKLESFRYLITDIEVYEEVFGTDDFDILYNFKAKNIDVKGGFTNLTESKIDTIHSNIYDEEGYVINTNISEVKNNG